VRDWRAPARSLYDLALQSGVEPNIALEFVRVLVSFYVGGAAAFRSRQYVKRRWLQADNLGRYPRLRGAHKRAAAKLLKLFDELALDRGAPFVLDWIADTCEALADDGGRWFLSDEFMQACYKFNVAAGVLAPGVDVIDWRAIADAAGARKL